MATTTTSAVPDSSLLTLPSYVLEHIVSLDPFPWAPVSRQLFSIATSSTVRAAWLLRLYITTQPHLPVLLFQELEQNIPKEHFDSISQYMEYIDAFQFGFIRGYSEGSFPVAPSEFVEISEDEAKLFPSRMTTTITEERDFLAPGPTPRRKIRVRRLVTAWRLWFFRVWVDQAFPFTSKLPPSTFFSEDVIAILLRRREATSDPDDRVEIDTFFASVFAHIVAEPDNPVLKALAQLPDLANAIPSDHLARLVEYAARHAPIDLVPSLLQNYYISPPLSTSAFIFDNPAFSDDPTHFLAQQNTVWHLLIRQDIPALTVLVDRGGHTNYVDYLGQPLLCVYFSTVWPGDLAMVQILLRGSVRVFESVEDGDESKLEQVLSPAIGAAIKYLQPIPIIALLVDNIHPTSMSQYIFARTLENAFETSRLFPNRIDPYEITDFMLPKVAWTPDDITLLMSTVIFHAKYHPNREATTVKVARELVIRGAAVEEQVARDANAPEELVRVVTGA